MLPSQMNYYRSMQELKRREKMSNNEMNNRKDIDWQLVNKSLNKDSKLSTAKIILKKIKRAIAMDKKAK